MITDSLVWFGVLSVGWYSVLVLMLRRQWLSRFRRGFFLTLLIGMISTGVGGVELIALWNYRAATRLLTSQIDAHLQDIGRILESQIERVVALGFERMDSAAKRLAADGMDAEAGRKLSSYFASAPAFLGAELYGADGRPVTNSLPSTGEEPTNMAVAFGRDGKSFRWGPYYSTTFKRYTLLLAVPVRAKGSANGALVVNLDLELGLNLLFEGVRFGKSGTAVITDRKGIVLAHSDRSRSHDDLSAYWTVQQALSGQSGFQEGVNNRGQARLFFYQPLPDHSSVDPARLALLTEMDRDEAAAPARKLLQESVLGATLVLLLAVLLSAQICGYIQRPLAELAGVVRKIREGDLSARFQRGGSDEVGQLGTALNNMAAGLAERDRVKELFGRYVTTQVSEKVLKGHINLGGELRRVTILFSDIRDFTTLSEQMSPQEVVTFLNHYFSEMVEAVFQYGGCLDKFIGDAIMAVFGSFGDEPDHPRQAVMAALRMKALLAKINGERGIAGQPPIRIGIGIHTDEVVVGNIGSHRRLEYTVIGDGVNTTARVEALNKDLGTTVLITDATYALVQDAFECQLMPEAKLRGKNAAIRFYEVLSAKSIQA